jgi:hypothetical protein
MTPEEYDEAVHALAVLVCNYWRAHPEMLREDEPGGPGGSAPAS